MKSKTAKKVVAIYSLIMGAIALFGTLGQGQFARGDGAVLILEVILIVMGVTLLIVSQTHTEKILIVIALIIYSFCMLAGLLVTFVIPPLGLLVMAMYGVPFIFSIIYLSSKKDKNIANHPNLSENHYHTGIYHSQSESSQIKLATIKRLYEDGLITLEEYEEKRKQIISRM